MRLYMLFGKIFCGLGYLLCDFFCMYHNKKLTSVSGKNKRGFFKKSFFINSFYFKIKYGRIRLNVLSLKPYVFFTSSTDLKPPILFLNFTMRFAITSPMP